MDVGACFLVARPGAPITDTQTGGNRDATQAHSPMEVGQARSIARHLDDRIRPLTNHGKVPEWPNGAGWKPDGPHEGRAVSNPALAFRQLRLTMSICLVISNMG